ncbi:MAG: murein hydrolase activator EnvC family protein, partial [Sphingosinicella sp.]
TAGFAAAAPRSEQATSFIEARREAESAEARYQALDVQARRATGTADRARAESAALAARIEVAESDITLAERRLALIAHLREAQQARLAERQQPLARLVGALQTMARRPAALALAQPGSLSDTVHVRALLAATLPEIRRRTAALRGELARFNALHGQQAQARAALAASREELAQRRTELGRFEQRQRALSRELAGLAVAQSDRALAFGEEARGFARAESSRRAQQQLGEALAALPPPIPRRDRDGAEGRERVRLAYRLPVRGRLLTGVGEISDAGVHSRGLTFATPAAAAVTAPAAGRILFAAPFRSYGEVVIIDHGGGWTSVITQLEGLAVRRGQRVPRGARIGRAGGAAPQLTVELRRRGRPLPIAQLLAG